MTNYTLPRKIDLSRVALWQYNNAIRLHDIINALEESAECCSVDLWKNITTIFNISDEIVDGDDLRLKRIGLTLIAQMFDITMPDLSPISDRPEYVKLDVLRRYILGRIYLMDSDGSAKDINEYLRIVLPNIVTYVVDNFDMTIQYAIPEDVQEGSLEYEILQIEGFLPSPAGVLLGDNKTLTDTEYTLTFQPYTDNEETQKVATSDIINEKLNTFNNSTFYKEQQ